MFLENMYMLIDKVFRNQDFSIILDSKFRT